MAVEGSDNKGDGDTLLAGTNVGGEEENSTTGTESNVADEGSDETGNEGDQDDGDAGKEGSDGSPDTYADFALPDGIELDSAALESAIPLFKELNLTQEQAQKLVDWQSKHVQASSEKQIDTFNQLKSDWRDQSENDSEFGGDQFDENIKLASAAVDKYGSPGLKKLFDDYGVGNHPEVVRFMVKVGKTLKEDVPGATGAATSTAKDRVSILYPNEKE